MLQPLGARVLVKRLEAEDKSSGGIILPEAAQEKPREGTVVAVGPGEVDDNGEPMGMSVKEGDVVIYASYGGTEIKIDGEEYLLINEDDLLAVRE
ncbi:MAG: co-chaperone GroES [candidate division WS1 bacterium]|jgi:chaperonin GroES|nr:co-chaperone GroES [candidate division WS1 bacterium]